MRTIDELQTEKRWEEIKYLLRINGTSLAGISKKLGIRQATLSKAKYGLYKRGEKEIANALGVEVRQLWPERYPKVSQ